MQKQINIKNNFSSFSIIVVFLALMIIGIAFIPMLNVRFKPSRKLPQITISYQWANTSPKIIEEETSKIEGVLGKLSQVKSIESISSVGSGRIEIKFDKNTDLNKKRYEVSTLIRQLRSNFPDEMSYPEISSNLDTEEENTSFMVLTVNANSSTNYMEDIANSKVISELLKTSGISDIRLYGATPYQREVRFDPKLLEIHNIVPEDIGVAINQFGEQLFLGTQKDGMGNSIPVLSYSKQIKPENWGNIAIANENGRIIRLADIAEVKLREKPPTSYYRVNGQNTINLVLYAAQGINHTKLSDEVRSKLKSIQESLPSGYSIHIASDSTLFIRNELNKIGLRTLFSLLILLLFVLIVSRSFRILLILSVSLIANLLIAVVFYYLLNVEIHIYSLAAITVSFGIIIDNSIIMVSHLQKQKGLRVFISLLAATLTTLGALSIVFFLKENQKILLVDFTYVMLINLTVSLVVSLFLVPALMDQFYHKKPKRSSFKLRRRIVAISSKYISFVRFERRFKWVFFMLIILTFGIPVWTLPDKIDMNSPMAELYNKSIGSELFINKYKPILNKILGGSLRLFKENVFESNFYSDPGKTKLYVRGKMPEGCTIQQLNEAIQKMEQYLSLFSEIKQFETQISSYRYSSITIHFKEEAERSAFPFLLKSNIEKKAISLGGMDWSVYGVGRGFSNALNMDYKNSHILLTGYNYNDLYRYAEILEQKLLKNPRVENTEISSNNNWYSATRYEYFLSVNKQILAYQYLDFSTYVNSLFTQLYSANLKSFYNKKELQDVVLYSSLRTRYNKWDFFNLPVMTSMDQKKLSQAGDIVKKISGKNIYKKNQVYQIYLNYNFIGPQPLSKIVQERAIEDINETLPLGYKAHKPERMYYWNNKDKKQYILLLLIILIIYFITSILFESLLKPLAVISLIPISFIGVFITFYIFKFNFDQGGFASFILLSGLVVNAAIYIIIDYNNLIRKTKKRACLRTYLKAFNQKIIAIMLTIISTVLSLIPFIWGGQSEVFWFAFAVGAMGGLIFSLVAIFFYLPLLLNLSTVHDK